MKLQIYNLLRVTVASSVDERKPQHSVGINLPRVWLLFKSSTIITHPITGEGLTRMTTIHQTDLWVALVDCHTLLYN